VRVFANATDDFCRELLNSLEEIPVRAAAPAGRTPTPIPAGPEPTREVERGLYK